MAKRATDKEDTETEEEPVTHPEEIRLEASLTIGGRPTARAAPLTANSPTGADLDFPHFR
jgi:hypothetical protein